MFCCCNLSRLSLAVFFPKEGFRGESMVLWIHRPIVGDQASAAAAVAAEAEAATTVASATASVAAKADALRKRKAQSAKRNGLRAGKRNGLRGGDHRGKRNGLRFVEQLARSLRDEEDPTSADHRGKRNGLRFVEQLAEATVRSSSLRPRGHRSSSSSRGHRSLRALEATVRRAALEATGTARSVLEATVRPPGFRPRALEATVRRAAHRFGTGDHSEISSLQTNPRPADPLTARSLRPTDSD